MIGLEVTSTSGKVYEIPMNTYDLKELEMMIKEKTSNMKIQS